MLGVYLTLPARTAKGYEHEPASVLTRFKVHVIVGSFEHDDNCEVGKHVFHCP